MITAGELKEWAARFSRNDLIAIDDGGPLVSFPELRRLTKLMLEEGKHTWLLAHYTPGGTMLKSFHAMFGLEPEEPEKKERRYEVIFDHDTTALECKVNAKLRNGATMLGGVSVSQNGIGGSTVYVQAIINH